MTDNNLWYLSGKPNPSTARLTFGVEMEFSIGCLINENQKDPDPEDKRNIYGIVNVPVEGTQAEKDEAILHNAETARCHVATTLTNAVLYAIPHERSDRVDIDYQNFKALGGRYEDEDAEEAAFTEYLTGTPKRRSRRKRTNGTLKHGASNMTGMLRS